ncbi:flippase [Haloarchaeobius sp. DT45]|uniref:flippase n=1 Tax=Haloarchaeobius sp. DT45 TaxID=3446116 RepID=UPI003F6C9827
MYHPPSILFHTLTVAFAVKSPPQSGTDSRAGVTLKTTGRHTIETKILCAMSDEDSVFGRLLRSGSLVLIGRILELGVSFVGAALIARLIGKVNFGAVGLGSTMLTVVGSGILLGLNTGISRFLPRYDDPERRRGVLVSAFELVLPVSVLTGVVLFIGAETIAARGFSDPSLTPILQIFAVGVPFLAVEKLSMGGIRGSQLTLPKVVVHDFALPATRVSLALAALWFDYGVVGIATAYMLSHVVAAALGTYYLWKHTVLFSSIRAKRERWTLLSFSLPLVVTSIMAKMLIDMDTFLLGYYSTTGEVGVYKVIYPLSNLVLLMLTAAGFMFMPVISQVDAEGGELNRTYQIVTKWIALGTIPLFVAIGFFPSQTLALTFGQEYIEGATALTVLAAGFFVHTLVGPNDSTLTSTGRTRIVMYDNVIIVGLNFALNILLIPRYSFLGAAVATSVSYAALNALYSIQLYHALGIHPVTHALARPAGAGLALAGVLYLVTSRLFGPVSVLGMIAAMLVYTALYAVVVLKLGGIENEEIELFLSFEQKYDVDLGPIKKVAKQLM